jgi:fatty-acyl-CoA synthase
MRPIASFIEETTHHINGKHYFDEFASYTPKDFLQLICELKAKFKNHRPGQVVIYDGENSIVQLALIVLCLDEHLVLVSLWDRETLLRKQEIINVLEPNYIVSFRRGVWSMEVQICQSPPLPIQEGGLLFRTSGSSGNPKWVFQPRKHIVINAQIARNSQTIDPGSRILSHLTMSHTGGVNMQLMPALISGASINLRRSFSIVDTIEALKEKKVSHMIMVPAHYRLIKSQVLFHAYNQRVEVLTGSAPVSLNMTQDLRSRGFSTRGVYGLTEVGPFICQTLFEAYNCDRKGFLLGTAVKPHLLFLNKKGQIEIESPIANFYFNAPTRRFTPISNEEGRVVTNDLGYVRDGHFFYLGRSDRQINIGGLKFQLEEIEEIVYQYPGVADCSVQLLSTSQTNKLQLFVNGSLKHQELKKFLKKRLHPLQFPTKIIMDEKVAKTSIDKNLVNL